MKKILYLLGVVLLSFSSCMDLPPSPADAVFVDVQLTHDYVIPVVMQMTSGRTAAIDWTHNLAPTDVNILFDRTDVDNPLKISFVEPLNQLHLKQYRIPVGTYNVTISIDTESITEYVFVNGGATGVVVAESNNDPINLDVTTNQHLILLEKTNLDPALVPEIAFNNSPSAFFSTDTYYYVYSTRTSFKCTYTLTDARVLSVSVNPSQSNSIYVLNTDPDAVENASGGFVIDMSALFLNLIQL